MAGCTIIDLNTRTISTILCKFKRRTKKKGPDEDPAQFFKPKYSLKSRSEYTSDIPWKKCPWSPLDMIENSYRVDSKKEESFFNWGQVQIIRRAGSYPAHLSNKVQYPVKSLYKSKGDVHPKKCLPSGKNMIVNRFFMG